MNRTIVNPIADAVLYEGYILYPYRPSVKNRQRWTFGGLYPESYALTNGGDPSGNQTECPIQGTRSTSFKAVIRFLHLTARLVGAVVPPLADWPEGQEPPARPVEALRVGGTLFQTWREAQEREVVLGEVRLGELSDRPETRSFTFPGGRRSERRREPSGKVVGVLTREQQAIEGVIEVAANEVEDGLFRLTLRVTNRTPLEPSSGMRRDEASLRALVSTHAILGVQGGAFVSLMDPPPRWTDAVAACRNVGTWPVLVGEEGNNDMMLSSPIILYDDPQVAPESSGNFFDGTEIDEMLTLRIMTLTDEEKTEMAAVDERASALLARTEATARDRLLALHGTVRGLRPVPEEGARG